METATMGKVTVPVRIESLEDLFSVQQGRLTPEQLRYVEVSDATVDTGASLLSLPTRFIKQLGLRPVMTRQGRTASGEATFQIYGTVRLVVQGRECRCDVTELPDVCPVLIGQIPLELMDWVVDPRGGRLIGNPEHGGEEMIDMF
jgi:predicted aspartyl protease